MAVKTATSVDPFDDARQRHAAGVFGMWLFLIMLAMLFGATILGYLVVRVNADPMEPFVPDDAPALPHLLLVSTVALLVSSYTMHRTVRAVRRGVQSAAARMAAATLLLAIAFLLLQAWAWLDLWRQNVRIDDGLYAWTFYVLTALHALHVIGGLVPLCVVCWRAARGRYSPQHPEGVMYCAMYWHFLDAVWLLLYATLWLGSLTW